MGLDLQFPPIDEGRRQPRVKHGSKSCG